MSYPGCRGDDPQVVILSHKARLQNIRLEHPVGYPSRINSTPAAPQPAKVAGITTWLQQVSPGLHSIVPGVLSPADPYPPQPGPTRLEARHPASHVSDSQPTRPEARHPASGVPDNGATLPSGAHYS